MYCILIAGMPATGKTRFATWLSGKRGLPFVSKDTIKEQLFDTVGFDSRDGKVALGAAAERILYYFAKQQMSAGCPLILENNFEDSSRDGILSLIETYDYTPVTVLFDGQIDEIYRRFVQRDQSPDRHRGHVVNTCYPEKGDPPAYVPMSPEQFAMGMEYRGFRRFDIGGSRICVDTTDFGQVDYERINAKITAALGEIIAMSGN